MINDNLQHSLSSAIELTLAKKAHPLLQAAAYAVQHANHVTINLTELNNLAATLSQDLSPSSGADVCLNLSVDRSNKFGERHWLESAPALVKNFLTTLTLQNRILFLTVFHTIGFCYWGNYSENSEKNTRWTVTLPEGDFSETKYLSTQVFSKTDLPSTEIPNLESKSKSSSRFDGAMALLVSMAINQDFLDLDYLARLNLEQFKTLLAGQLSENIDSLPLLKERHEFIVSLAQKMRSENYLQTLLPLLATTSAMALALKLAHELPGYLDIAYYKGKEILFLKRAQLLVSDINHTIQISKIEELTAFADYKLPQLLRHYQVISYEPALAKRVDQLSELEPGSEEEVEIRAATIIAVELLRQELEKSGLATSASAVDSQLWLLSQRLDKTKLQPYHRCKTVFY